MACWNGDFSCFWGGLWLLANSMETNLTVACQRLIQHPCIHVTWRASQKVNGLKPLTIIAQLSMGYVFGNPDWCGDWWLHHGKITLVLDLKKMMGSSETAVDIFRFLFRNITRYTNQYDNEVLPFEIRKTRQIWAFRCNRLGKCRIIVYFIGAIARLHLKNWLSNTLVRLLFITSLMQFKFL